MFMLLPSENYCIMYHVRNSELFCKKAPFSNETSSFFCKRTFSVMKWQVHLEEKLKLVCNEPSVLAAIIMKALALMCYIFAN